MIQLLFKLCLKVLIIIAFKAFILLHLIAYGKQQFHFWTYCPLYANSRIQIYSSVGIFAGSKAVTNSTFYIGGEFSGFCDVEFHISKKRDKSFS